MIERGEHPQHERAEEIGLVLDVLQLEDADQALSVALLHQVVNVELRLAKKYLSSLLLELDHVAK